jgi:hypothetical protein
VLFNTKYFVEPGQRKRSGSFFKNMKPLIWLVGIVVAVLVAAALLLKGSPAPSREDCAFKEYDPYATFTVPASEVEKCLSELQSQTLGGTK